MKQDTSLITQEFNATLKTEIESNSSAISEAETLKVRMAEMEKAISLMNQKLTAPGNVNGAQGPCALPVALYTTSERYSKKTITDPSKNCCGDWGRQVIKKEGEGRIRLMLQNM